MIIDMYLLVNILLFKNVFLTIVDMYQLVHDGTWKTIIAT